MWILEASKARRGGSTRFPERLAAELVKVLTGDSSALSKKQLLHKTALVNRSNVILMDRKR